MFRVFDINQNGIVTKDEVLYAAGGQDKYVEDIIQELDQFHGDEFTMQEFVLLMKYVDQKQQQ